MKTKKHASPMQMLGSMFLLGGWSAMYLLNSLTFGTDSLEIWLLALIAILTVGMMTVSLVFNVMTFRNKNLRKGDEFTTRSIRKAAYMAFVTIICLSAIFFVALQITMLTGKDSSGNYAGGINDLLDVRVILSAVAAIQIIGTFMFTLLFFIYSKKGDADGI